MFQKLLKKIQNLTLVTSADGLVRALFAILPFNVVLTVFIQYKLGIPAIAYLKEVVIFTLAVFLVLWYWKKREFPKLDLLDYSILAYIGILVVVTIGNRLGLGNIVYGGRYDFEFFIVLMLFKHLSVMLPGKLSEYIRIAVISASWAIGIGLLVRLVFGESILLHLGFSADLSNWKFSGAPPIYHGIEGASVRRFQGIFDGPNPAAYFILVYVGILAHYMKQRKEYFFLLSIWGAMLLIVLFYTYSRSSVIGLVAALLFMLGVSIRAVWQHHKKIVLWTIPVLIVLSGLFYLKFERVFSEIILREGSSKGHFSRVVTGLERFAAHPLGQGLATSGPAYRYVMHPETDEGLFVGDNKKLEDYYIPESWYVQQLVEGWIFGTLAFLWIFLLVLIGLVKRSLPIAGSFVALSTMLLFLHTLESVFISIFFFAIIGLVLGKTGLTKKHS